MFKETEKSRFPSPIPTGYIYTPRGLGKCGWEKVGKTRESLKTVSL